MVCIFEIADILINISKFLSNLDHWINFMLINKFIRQSIQNHFYNTQFQFVIGYPDCDENRKYLECDAPKCLLKDNPRDNCDYLMSFNEEAVSYYGQVFAFSVYNIYGCHIQFLNVICEEIIVRRFYDDKWDVKINFQKFAEWIYNDKSIILDSKVLNYKFCPLDSSVIHLTYDTRSFLTKLHGLKKYIKMEQYYYENGFFPMNKMMIPAKIDWKCAFCKQYKCTIYSNDKLTYEEILIHNST